MVGIFTDFRCNWCSLTSASPALTKIFFGRKTLNDFVSFPLFYKKTNSSHCLDVQKENRLLSTWWPFQPKGFLDKTGRGWSRDAVINNFKMKFEHFLVMVGLNLLDLRDILKKTLH